jgi:plastocyanin
MWSIVLTVRSLRRMRTTRIALATTAAALSLLACGGDDDDAGGSDSPPPAEGSLVVTAVSGLAWDSDSYEADAGDVTIVYENDDSIPHTLVIEDQDFELTEDGESGDITLEPGEYVIFCGVPGHRSAGMEATLTVS